MYDSHFFYSLGDFGGQKKTPSEEGAEIKSSESRCGSRGADTAR